MIFTIAMKNVDLLKINPSSHFLENETATVYQNIGKISVNQLLVCSGHAGTLSKFKEEQADYEFPMPLFQLFLT